METPHLDRLMTQATNDPAVPRVHPLEYYVVRRIFADHGPALVAALTQAIRRTEDGTVDWQEHEAEVLRIQSWRHLLAQLDREAQA